MCFGHHRDTEYGVALLADKRREANVFATNGNHCLVAEFESGEVRFGVGVEAQNLVASELEFTDGRFQVVRAANLHLVECACGRAGHCRCNAAHALGREHQEVYAEGERATDACTQVARVFDVGADGNQLAFAVRLCLEIVLADVFPYEKFLFVEQGDYAMVLLHIAAEHLGIDLLHVHVDALGKFLQLIELGVARLVHKEHAMNLHGAAFQKVGHFADAANRSLRGIVSCDGENLRNLLGVHGCDQSCCGRSCRDRIRRGF